MTNRIRFIEGAIVMIASKHEQLAEIARRAQKAYDRHVLPQLKPEDHGKFIVVDIETGDYEIGDDSLPISVRMRDRYPAERLWLMRVGHKAAFRMGMRSTYTFPRTPPLGETDTVRGED